MPLVLRDLMDHEDDGAHGSIRLCASAMNPLYGPLATQQHLPTQPQQHQFQTLQQLPTQPQQQQFQILQHQQLPMHPILPIGQQFQILQHQQLPMHPILPIQQQQNQIAQQQQTNQFSALQQPQQQIPYQQPQPQQQIPYLQPQPQQQLPQVNVISSNTLEVQDSQGANEEFLCLDDHITEYIQKSEYTQALTADQYEATFKADDPNLFIGSVKPSEFYSAVKKIYRLSMKHYADAPPYYKQAVMKKLNESVKSLLDKWGVVSRSRAITEDGTKELTDAMQRITSKHQLTIDELIEWTADLFNLMSKYTTSPTAEQIQDSMTSVSFCGVNCIQLVELICNTDEPDEQEDAEEYLAYRKMSREVLEMFTILCNIQATEDKATVNEDLTGRRAEWKTYMTWLLDCLVSDDESLEVDMEEFHLYMENVFEWHAKLLDCKTTTKSLSAYLETINNTDTWSSQDKGFDCLTAFSIEYLKEMYSACHSSKEKLTEEEMKEELEKVDEEEEYEYEEDSDEE